MRFNLKIILAVTLLAVMLLAGCSTTSPQPKVGTKAPDFRLNSLDGKAYQLDALAGQPVLLNFWSTTCPPCITEMPHLQAAYDAWKGRGLVLLAINLGENTNTVRNFVQNNKITFPVLLDSDLTVGEKYYADFIPVSFFIDKNGIIQNRVSGAFRNKDAVDKQLAKLFE